MGETNLDFGMTTPVTQQDRIEAKLDLLLTLTIASQAKDYSENSPGVIRHVTDDQYKGCLQRLDQMWNEWGDILKPLQRTEQS